MRPPSFDFPSPPPEMLADSQWKLVPVVKHLLGLQGEQNDTV